MRMNFAERPVLVNLHRRIGTVAYLDEVVVVASTRVVAPTIDDEAALPQLVFLGAAARECHNGNASRYCRTY